ncbi:SDR family oxidoreductase [Microbacterium protaetiae]|uniref:SDR family oxidoreductase n=1 Tax=Microbacterium protaetiae TaxID=2509458 RepID=A0A4P6EGB4_9MICO|nr:SDR family oxidoreductase [Microbacterium protaetiae]QAY60473.1 SDR family oxidoreductase [Microbacterium protaetiae]
MHIFITGASGWVGSALVPELIAHGHTVAALARTDRSAARARSLGADVVPGTLDDHDLVGDATASADAVIHLAFKHDVAFAGDYAGAAHDDRAVIDVFTERLAGTGKALVVASGILGVLGLTPGVIATEADGRFSHEQPGPVSGGSDRAATARHVLTLAERGIRSSVVRLPPATHGRGDNGFTATAVNAAKKAGVSVYVGEGANRWPAVHRDDAAELFRRAVESAPAGAVVHAVAEQGVQIRQVAETIASRLDVPAISVDQSDVGRYLGFLGGFWSADGPASAEVTRELFGWAPSRPSWLDDLRSGAYDPV